jgi:hypothetical protein
MQNTVDRDVGFHPCHAIASAIVGDASQGCGSLENRCGVLAQQQIGCIFTL